MIPQRVSLVTLGVADLARARAFYTRLGWRESGQSQEGVAFFQLQGAALALFGLADLAEDQGRRGAPLGTGAITLAQNFAREAEVDQAYATALAAGAVALKPPVKVFWGGYSGYWADLDGHVWEVACNPFWPLARDGALPLPDRLLTADLATLTDRDRAEIEDLLVRCGFGAAMPAPGGWRHLLRAEGRIIAHIAVELRRMRLGESLRTVAALEGLAVAPEARGAGQEARLLAAAIERASAARAEFVLGTGKAEALRAAGFRPAPNAVCRATPPDERAGGRPAPLPDGEPPLFFLPIGPSTWDEMATLDCLGPMFRTVSE